MPVQARLASRFVRPVHGFATWALLGLINFLSLQRCAVVVGVVAAAYH